jgi:hypothetical protein
MPSRNRPNGSSSSLNIFVSYRENDEKSCRIADDLNQFFDNWGVVCHVIRKVPGSEPPRLKMSAAIKRSTHFFQILTRDPSPSEWMEKELGWFRFEQGENGDQKVVVLHTDDNQHEDLYPENSEIANKIGAGDITTVLCEDSNKVKLFLRGILLEAGVLPFPQSRSHEFVLPKFCQQRDTVDFGILEDHLRNFRGLQRFYSDKNTARQRLEQKLKNLRKGDLIRMLGFTLRRYVHPSLPGKPPNAMGQSFCDVVSSKGVKAQLLILSRNCPAAKERMAIESPDIPTRESVFFKDNKDVVDHFKESRLYDPQKREANSVQIKYYQTPYVGMIVFEDELFVEIYHLGDDGDDAESLVGTNKKTICGRVPILVIEKDKPFYKLFKSHFERVWEGAKWA